MAQVENPRKQFNFSIFAPGLNPFLAQKVMLPDVGFDVTKHGDTNYYVKTAGMLDVGTLNIEKISSATAPDSWIWQWIRLIQDAKLGGGALPIIYKRTLEIHHYSNDGITVLNKYIFEGCWPSKLNGVELSRQGSDNTLESIEFQVDIPSAT